MDYQSYINCIEYPAAVLSVQKAPDGSCGAIHIVCANKLYKDTMGPAYYDGMPYYELVPQDVKFEDFCFRTAIGRQKMQSYDVHSLALVPMRHRRIVSSRRR